MKNSIRYVLAPALGLLLSVTTVIAGPGGGGKDVRSSAKSNVNNASSNRNTNVNNNTNKNRNTNVNNNTNVNRNTNVNKNTNVNVNKDVNVNVNNNRNYNDGCCYHSGIGVGGAVAVAAAATATAVVVGSMVNTLPPSCTTVMVNGVTYQQCGSTWYQPQFSGGSTTYVVINAPR